MEDETWVVYFLIWVFIGGGVGFLIGQAKGRSVEGAFFGAMLGVIGWLILLCGQDHRRKCRACLGAVPEGASKCCHCGESLAGVPSAAPMLYTRPVSEPGWSRVACPSCSTIHQIPNSSLIDGMKCSNCQIGFVPVPIK